MRRLVLLLLALVLAPAPAQDSVSPEVFSTSLPDLDDAGRAQFGRGRALVRQSWIAAPSRDQDVDGLGPLYNRLACISCHPRNGRGRPPDDENQRMLSMLVRLSVPGNDEHGGPKPHPAYGGQLNEEGIPGVPGEGRTVLFWEERDTVTLPGGEVIGLRRPRVEFREPAYGPLDGVLTSLRVGPQLVGMGLLDAVPERLLEQLAMQPKPDGIEGRVNRVWNPESKRMEAGRFGYKANVPSLRVQAASAFHGDLGITSLLFPDENCTPSQGACRSAPGGGRPELSAAQLDEVEFYIARLQVPPRRNSTDPVVQRGEIRFAELGCIVCHREELQTGDHGRLPAQTIRPYTDLLIHDMGGGLSDHRADYLAGGRDWRTAPLWGIGLTETVSESAYYLHDGRARDLTEAILWHGGEADSARNRFSDLPMEDRDALLLFLKSL